MLATVGVTDRQQLALGVVVIAGALAVRIDGLDHIALGVAPVLPHGFAARAGVQETVAVFVGRRFIVWRNQRHQPSGFVVAVLGDGAQREIGRASGRERVCQYV